VSSTFLALSKLRCLTTLDFYHRDGEGQVALIQINNVGYRTSINTLQVDAAIAKPFEYEREVQLRFWLAAWHQLRSSKSKLRQWSKFSF